MAEMLTIIGSDNIWEFQAPSKDKQFQFYDGKFKKIPLILSQECSLDVQYRSIMKHQNSEKVKTSHLLRYLYDFALEYMTIQGDMTVDGVTIDPLTICPSSLFDVKLEDNPLDQEEGSVPSVDKKNSLALLILTRVRYCKVPDGEHFDTMRNGLILRVKSLIEADANLTEIVTDLSPTAPSKSAYSSETMLKMLAAYDWFLFPRPEHQLSALRFGTLSTRFYGMTFYDSLVSIVHQSSFSLPEFVSFLLHPRCQEEMNTFFNAMRDTANFDGLFPYQKSLGIVSKSVFSVQACPNTHTFLSAIGIFKGNMRCIHARVIPNVEVIELGFHAAAMVNTVSGAYGQAYFPTIADREAKNCDLGDVLEGLPEDAPDPENQEADVLAAGENGIDQDAPAQAEEDNPNDAPVPRVGTYSKVQQQVEEYMKVLMEGNKEEQFGKVYFPGIVLREGTISQYLEKAIKSARK